MQTVSEEFEHDLMSKLKIQDEHKEEHDEVEEEDEEEEFSFVFMNPDGSPISADEAFDNGQIRPVFPVFNQDLLFADGDDFATGHRSPIKKVFVQQSDNSPSSTAAEASKSELVEPPEGPYCQWAPKFRSTLTMIAPSYSGVASNPSYCRSGFPSSDCKISPSCSHIRNVSYVTCHSNCYKSTSQASLFLCHDSTTRRNGVLGGPFCCDPLAKRNLVGQASYSVGTTTLDGVHLESPSHVAEEKVGVLLLNLGGPETLNDVQPFLFNLFADPDIIRLPRLFRFLQRPLAKLISVLRAPKSKEGYAAIGGGSPLRKITDDQALALKMALEVKGLSSNVYVGMRYWYPFTEEAVQQIKTDGITRLVVLPLYPQFSISTTGSSIRVLQQMFREDAYLSRLPVSTINSWYQREGYIKSMADLIEKELHSFSEPEEAMIFFSAHGVPVSYVEDAGDPYRDQMEECIFLIMQELKARGISNEHTLAYQSRVGPVQWLKPYTDEVLVELGQKGVKSLLAVPVSFVSEHIETLEEIDMEYRELALNSGIKNWARVPALGLTPSFITDLADAVIEALPSATAMYTPTSTPEDVDHDPVTYFVKIFFGSILAFFLLLSPKMMMAFKNLVI